LKQVDKWGFTFQLKRALLRAPSAFLAAAAAVVALHAAAVVGGHTVVAAATEQDEQNDDPAAVAAPAVITHNKYLQVLLSRLSVRSFQHIPQAEICAGN
jgi:hypothetical protein